MSIAFSCCAFAVPVLAQEPEANRAVTGTLTFSPDEEALYLERYEQAQKRKTADEIYHPLEVMAGADDWESLPAAAPQERAISEAALRDAAAFAGASQCRRHARTGPAASAGAATGDIMTN